MAPADDAAALEAASASGRRRGQPELVGWGAVFCFGSRRRERRTVPVDGDLLVSGAADRDVTRRGGNKETRKRPRVKGCCFLTPPARPPPPGRRKHAGTIDSGSGSGRSTHDNQQQLEHTKEQQALSPSSEPVPWQIQPAAGGSRSRRAPAETRSTRPMTGNEEPSKGVVGTFGPVVGLSVVSMVGLLGGRVLAVACVCAWLAALSGLRHGRERRRFTTSRITRSPSWSGGYSSGIGHSDGGAQVS